MENASFFLKVKGSLENATNLQNVQAGLTKLVTTTESEGKKLGFVVGKITPANGETLAENKTKLMQNTEEISKLAQSSGVVVFSSAAIPDNLEGKFPAEEFYKVFDSLVIDHVTVLYTTEGWESSQGAQHEVQIARQKGIEIYNYNQGTLTLLES